LTCRQAARLDTPSADREAWVSPEDTGSPVEVGGAMISQDKPLGVLHTGSRFALGFGSDFYGIWDQLFSGPPQERFAPTPAGKLEAWQRYAELEPSVGDSGPPWLETGEPAVEEAGTRRRWIVLGAVAVVIVGGIVVSRLGGEQAPGEGGGGSAATNQARVEVSGAITQSLDLTLEEADIRGPRTILPKWEATWASPAGSLYIIVTVGEVGEIRTNENPPRRVQLTFSPGVAAPDVVFASRPGQCTITLDIYTDDHAEGSFLCEDVTLEGQTEPVRLSGSFSAGT
jgi:hypothetical protein